jgi:hypothetical protein
MERHFLIMMKNKFTLAEMLIHENEVFLNE